MPKENIKDEVADGFRVQVGWGQGTYVQVASINDNSTLQLPEDDHLPPGSKAEPFTGWHVTLDREGCNRMIRSLRRARDSAFGADA